jgi:hypothetical protein
MDFNIGFPKTIRKHDAMMVVVDKLRKVAHLIHNNSSFKFIEVVDVL